MKKQKFTLLVVIILLFVFTFIGCKSSSSENSGDVSQSTNNNTTNTESNKYDLSRTDAYRRDKRQLAIADSNNDIYLLSHTTLKKLSHIDGKITTLLEGFEFGHDIDLHNEYIYYQIESTLYRMDKNGKDIQTCTLNLEPNLFFVCFDIINDTLCISVYNDKNDMKVEYMYADISNDPISLSFSPTAKDFDFKKYEAEKNKYYTMIKSNSSFNVDLQIVEATANHIYFAASSSTEGGPRKLGRVSVETQEIEMLDISPYRPEKVTIANGWIYYEPIETDKTKEIWRMSEDLTKNEKTIK